MKVALISMFFSLHYVSGVIPQEIGNLHISERLYLQFNKLIGSIPGELFNISTLTRVQCQ